MKTAVHATVVVLIAVILCAGCGGREPAPASATSTTAPASPGVGTLTFWHILNYPGPREVLAEAVARFQSANPGIKVNLQTFENDAYKTKLSVEMASGTPPDILFTWGGGGLAAFADAKRVVDLTDALAKDDWRERFLPQPLAFCARGDRLFAVPLDLSGVVFWCNADLFAAHGLTPPRTFDELLDVCGKLRAKGTTPIALGNSKQWPGAFYFVYLAARAGGTPLFFDAAARKPGAGFADRAFVRAGELLQRLIEAKAFSTGFNGVDDAQARAQFLNGEAAMFLTGTWLVARAQEERPEMLPKLKCFPFPAVEGGQGDPTVIVGGINCAFAVSAACKTPEKAIDLLRCLTTEKVGEQWCRTGRIPAVRVSDAALAQLPAPTRAALDLLRAAKVIQPYYDQYLPPRLAEEHKKTTQGLFAGTLKPAEAAERMEKVARELEVGPGR